MLITTALSTVTATNLISTSSDSTPPIWRNQGQNASTIRVGDPILLYAEGKDDVALDYAYLSTNETGVWQDFKGLLDWQYVREITIDHTLVQEDVTNFAVPIKITDSLFTSHAQSDGDDFVFYDDTQSTKLSHEIELYNSGTGELIAWVNVPLLSASQDTIIYMYYGNPSALNQEDIAGTWNANYVFVQHMTGSTLSDLKDSTSNNFDITGKSGSPGYNAAGKVGNCVSFGGSEDLQAADFELHDGSYTVSAWVLPDDLWYDNYVVSGNNQGHPTIGNPCLMIEEYFDYIFYARVLSKTGTPYTAQYDSLDANDVWTYMTGRADLSSSKVHIFVDGNSKNSGSIGSIKAATNGINIGSNAARQDKITGSIDEVRVAETAFSDGWIKTEYNSMAKSSFVTVGSEQSADAVGQIVYGSPMMLQENDQWQWSNFTWQNPDIPEDTTVGWTITYVDESGNEATTDVLSFKVSLNAPPYQPDNPDPVNGETNVDRNHDLSWTGGDPDEGDGDIVTYTVYLGTTSPLPEIGTTTDTSFDPGTLTNATIYQWQILATDSLGATTLSETWSFTTVNNPPNPPTTPNPANNSDRIPLSKNLQWVGNDPDSADSVTFDLYFDEDKAQPKDAVPLIAEDLSASLYNPPEDFNYSTSYVWYIVVKDSFELTTEGPVWKFTTRPFNDPPYEPENPTPENESTGVSRFTQLSWKGGDFNIPEGDSVNYTIYLEQNSPPTNKVGVTGETTFDPGRLQYNTTYYWQIVAEDSRGVTTEGPIWHFTTEIAVPKLVITDITGGMGLHITIENQGDGDAKNAAGMIEFKGSGFFLPKDPMVIPPTNLARNESITIDQFIFGIAFNNDININIETPTSYASKRIQRVFVIGPFVLIPD